MQVLKQRFARRVLTERRKRQNPEQSELCNFGSLANAGVATVQITVKVNGAGNKTSISNTATASTSTFDPNILNNSATVITQITGNKK